MSIMASQTKCVDKESKFYNRSMKSWLQALRKKCPYPEFFWPILLPIWLEYGEIAPYLSVVSRNTGKYGPQKL